MTEPAPFPSDPFWDFSLAVYGRPGFAQAAIALQDDLGVDVNMMLFCGWVASQGRRLTRDDLIAIDAKVAAWQHDIVHPLREIRRRLRDKNAAIPADLNDIFKKRLQAVEIDAEHVEQLVLGASLPLKASGSDLLSDTAANVALYVEFVAFLRPPSSADHLKAVVAGFLPDARPDAIAAALEEAFKTAQQSEP
jgi:uncharacterized protein (TIGR02444 family)